MRAWPFAFLADRLMSFVGRDQRPVIAEALVVKSDIALRMRGRVAELVLDRPEKRNAITMAMWSAMPGLLAEAAADPAVRVLVVRGAGAAFAAGADIAEFETTYATRDAALANQETMAKAMTALERFALPTIAAIRGACVGGGCGLALACDLRIADSTARVGITPAKLGLVYGVGDTRRLVEAVGFSAAKSLLFTGRILDAAEAQAIGLLDRVVDAQSLDAAVAEMAETIAGASSFTARATKAIIARLREGVREDDAESRALFADAFEGADFQEGRTAFLQKRTPRFP